MPTYAVIKLNGKQHLVEAGQKMTIDRLEQAEGSEFKLDQVLLIGDEKTQEVGTPLVDKASVSIKVLENKKGPKLRVGKFKAKSRYRRVRGHRQHLSVIEIVKINVK